METESRPGDDVTCDFDVALCVEERFAREGSADGQAQGLVEGKIQGVSDAVADSFTFGEKVGDVLANAFRAVDLLPPEKAGQVELLSSKVITAVNSPMSDNYFNTVLEATRNLERWLAVSSGSRGSPQKPQHTLDF